MLDLAEMPESPKTVGAWTIRQILSPDGDLKRLDYPFKKASAEMAEEEGDPTNDAEMWPMNISFPIPPNVCVDKESVKVMYWNEEYRMWDDHGITDDDIDLELGRVRCRTVNFAPTAVVQNTHSELPYKDWVFQPTGPNRATLHIFGRKNELELDIREGECQLIGASSEYLPNNLRQTWLPPSLLLKRLSQCGLNFRGPTSMKGVEMPDWVLKVSSYYANILMDLY